MAQQTIATITINGVTMNVEDETARQAVANCVNNGYYNSAQRKIILRNGSNIIVEIDANAFIKDGMVSDVTVEDGYLVITFNTDAGKEPIRIPLTDIFDPSNYYTRTQLDTMFGATATEINNIGVFDISINNPTNNSPSTYASLADALGAGGANIPQAKRKAGMMVRYIDSTLNQYVHYLLVNPIWTTNTSMWHRIPNLVHLSQDDYDALSTAAKMNGDWYFVEEEE